MTNTSFIFNTCSVYRWRRQFVLHLPISFVWFGKPSPLYCIESNVCQSREINCQNKGIINICSTRSESKKQLIGATCSYHRSLQFGIVVLCHYWRLLHRVKDHCGADLLAWELWQIITHTYTLFCFVFLHYFWHWHWYFRGRQERQQREGEWHLSADRTAYICQNPTWDGSMVTELDSNLTGFLFFCVWTQPKLQILLVLHH